METNPVVGHKDNDDIKGSFDRVLDSCRNVSVLDSEETFQVVNQNHFVKPFDC